MNSTEIADAEKYENAEGLEITWATEAMGFAERHWELLTGLPDKSKLKITKADKELHAAFRTAFPHMDLAHVNEEEMKSNEGKAKWRAFLEGVVKPLIADDFKFGTLLRTNSRGRYDPENTLLVLRGQFYAIEVSRNYEGLNSDLIA